MSENKVTLIDETKDLPKEFCLLCGRYVDSLEDVPTINFGQQTLIMKMCKSCRIVVHNFLRMADEAMKRAAAEQMKLKEKKIISPYNS